jgi:hypothetical protein
VSRSPRKQRLALGIGVDDMTLLTMDSGKTLCSIALDAYVKDASAPEGAEWLSCLAGLVTQAGIDGGVELHVTVADHWSRYWMQAVPDGIGQLAELRTLSAARFESLFGLKAEAWSIAADWQSSGLVLACAMPRSLVEALRNPPHDVWSLASLQPASVRALSRNASKFPAEGWVLCSSSTGITLFQISSARVCHVRRHPTTGVPTVPMIEALIEAEILRRNASSKGDLHVFGRLRGNLPGEQLAGLRIVLPRQDKKRAAAGTGPESYELGWQGVVA